MTSQIDAQTLDRARFEAVKGCIVEGVSWYEALALTHWLTKRWQQAGLLPDELRVQLPSEAEWTRSLYKDYPYRVEDGCEKLSSDNRRVIRAGAIATKFSLG